MIIKSILDNDLYKFSMNFAILKLFSSAKVRYKLIFRSDVNFPDGFAEKLREEIKLMESLSLTPAEKKFFSEKCTYIDPSYFDFLEGYKYNSTEIGVIQNGGKLELNIEGYWFRVVLWEVPLLALISELYFKMLADRAIAYRQAPDDIDVIEETVKIKSKVECHENNQKKAALFNYSTVKVADFGTRRRFSFNIQKEMVEDLSTRMTKGLFVGTSNVYLAYLLNLTPIGTEAHEWFMFHGAKYGFQMATELGLKHWADVYNGDLGTALSDTYTTDAFLKGFSKTYAKLYDGVRQDSGDVYEFANKLIEHYKKMGIDPMSKTIIFSDSLTPEKAIEIQKWCNGKIKCSFGIGTNLSNDVGVTPLNMVIKMTAAKPTDDSEWIPTIKLSDHEGKHTGDAKMIETCKYLLNIK
jgi:nicotinate phosphoribosyltransferase